MGFTADADRHAQGEERRRSLVSIAVDAPQHAGLDSLLTYESPGPVPPDTPV